MRIVCPWCRGNDGLEQTRHGNVWYCTTCDLFVDPELEEEVKHEDTDRITR